MANSTHQCQPVQIATINIIHHITMNNSPQHILYDHFRANCPVKENVKTHSNRIIDHIHIECSQLILHQAAGKMSVLPTF